MRTAQIFIFLVSFLIHGCQAQVKVDENFIQLFSPEIRPQVISMCEQYDSNDQVQGIYFSRYAFGLYTFIGIKNNRFEILSFDDAKYSSMDKVSDIELQTGQYIKRNDQIILKTEKMTQTDPLVNQSADFENLIYLQNSQSAFLIKDIENVASSMSWSQTMGSTRSQLKKIHCHIQDYHHYKGDEEPSPSYQALPERFKPLVIDQPMHLTIKSAEDILKSLERNDDSETVIEQKVQLISGNTRKLFINQPICIIQGQGKGLYGYINQPNQPLTTAWMSFEQGASTGIAKQGDIISTSYQECKSLN
ncbi:MULTISPECIES: hypothetical protein [unclassified Acinetobacter]|uniref:hypothetical protein n=1 Tax=unclassified Acinetobacter TaxID=196816 RepID=UPI0018A8C760|nr:MULTISPECIES: hypothetical protein [unclassified Acinetobacter]MBJ9954050.1 hypothetical protein [Acinetobacter baumannii]